MTTPAMSRISRITLALLQSLLLLAPGVRAASYGLKENYFGDTFFDAFDFFTDADPTHGFVTYIDRTEATNLQLAYTKQDGAVYMGVDSSSILDPGGAGRKSIRIESKKTWTHGLFIADITHMPGGICGTWPAFWMFGPNWPNSGEIDIIEGVNSQKNNVMSLHSSPGCTVVGNDQLGTLQTSDCDASQNYNSGCGSSASTPGTYGAAFNAASGGVYATEWTSESIKIWFFNRGDIPADITAGNPEPSTWGTPEANFEGGCDIDSKFKDHKLIFDTTFCGDWGNAAWYSDPVCSSHASTCNGFVAGNPQAFAGASWSINYVRVFESLNEGDRDPASGDPAIPLEPISAPAVSDGPLPGFPDVIRSLEDISIRPTAVFGEATADGFFTVLNIVPTTEANPAQSSRPLASSLSISTPTVRPIPSPPFISGDSLNVNTAFGLFAYIGCIAFSQLSESPVKLLEHRQMTIDKCIHFCHSSKHAFVWGNACHCMEDLPKYKLYDRSDCDLRCPGNSDEICGGNLPRSTTIIKRRELGTQAKWDKQNGFPWDGKLFSLYSSRFDIQDVIDDASDHSFPGLSSSQQVTKDPPHGLLSGLLSHKGGLLGHKFKLKHTHSRSMQRLKQDETSSAGTDTHSMKRTGQQEYTKVVTTTYVDVCSCAEETLTMRTLTTTLTYCPHPAIRDHNVPDDHKIPMYTTSKSCNGAGCEAGAANVTIPITKTVTHTRSKKPASLGDDILPAHKTTPETSGGDEYRSTYTHAAPPTWTGVHPYATSTRASTATSGSSSFRGNNSAGSSGTLQEQLSTAESRTKTLAWGWGVEGAVCWAIVACVIVLL